MSVFTGRFSVPATATVLSLVVLGLAAHTAPASSAVTQGTRHSDHSERTAHRQARPVRVSLRVKVTDAHRIVFVGRATPRQRVRGALVVLQERRPGTAWAPAASATIRPQGTFRLTRTWTNGTTGSDDEYRAVVSTGRGKRWRSPRLRPTRPAVTAWGDTWDQGFYERMMPVRLDGVWYTRANSTYGRPEPIWLESRGRCSGLRATVAVAEDSPLDGPLPWRLVLRDGSNRVLAAGVLRHRGSSTRVEVLFTSPHEWYELSFDFGPENAQDDLPLPVALVIDPALRCAF